MYNRPILKATLVALTLALAACAQNSQPGMPTPQLSGLEVAAPAHREMIFSTVANTERETKTLTLRNVGGQPLELTGLTLGGTNAGSFEIASDLSLPAVIAPAASLSVDIVFEPDTVGRHEAKLVIENSDPTAGVLEVGLYGLAALGEQGENEPPLQEIAHTLGYPVDVGGSGLTLSAESVAIGSETLVPLFQKAGSGPVTLSLVARYGPEEDMPFGYFTLTGSDPSRT